MRIILDSNVFIAAYIARVGICHEVLEHCLTNEAILVNDYILQEIKRNLTKKIRLPHKIVESILIHIRQNTEWVHFGKPDSKIQCRDPKDVPIVDLLLQTKAELLITGDKDLLEEKSLKNMGIISPRLFMKKYMSS